MRRRTPGERRTPEATPIETKPDCLEPAPAGGHGGPAYLADSVDPPDEIRKHRHPIDARQRARRGTEH